MQEDGHKNPVDGDPEESSESIWFVQIPDDKLVVRLQAVVKKTVPWLADLKSPGSVDCAGLVGSFGQVIIRPTTQMPAAWKRVSAKLSKRPAEFGEERRPWFDIARIRAASSLVTVSLEGGGRVSLYLSTVLSDAKIGPGRGEDAVIIAIGEVLEVWRRDSWEKWLLRTGENSDSIEKAALQAIARRPD